MAKTLASNEHRIDKTGPSLIESEVGSTRGAKGTVFHEKTYGTEITYRNQFKQYKILM